MTYQVTMQNGGFAIVMPDGTRVKLADSWDAFGAIGETAKAALGADANRVLKLADEYAASMMRARGKAEVAKAAVLYWQSVTKTFEDVLTDSARRFTDTEVSRKIDTAIRELRDSRYFFEQAAGKANTAQSLAAAARPIGLAIAGFQLAVGLNSDSAYDVSRALVGVVASLLATVAATAVGLSLGSMIGLALFAGFAFDYLFTAGIAPALGWTPSDSGSFRLLLSDGLGMISEALQELVRGNFDGAQRALFRRDPLTLDLDGDALETVPTSAGVLFDHDGDGVRTGTGWVARDDGFLVLDRDGNGTIDSGRELFGDSTLKSDGTVAVDGFDALADLDTNLDGKVNDLDAFWDRLRVWRDLDQDGVSDAGELLTLESLGIAGFNTAKTENAVVLADGNRIADLGTYLKSDGTTATMGDVGAMADIDLAEDTFHRRFDDPIPLTAAAETLPTMQGSGLVRDMREAASLPGENGEAFATALQGYASVITRRQSAHCSTGRRRSTARTASSGYTSARIARARRPTSTRRSCARRSTCGRTSSCAEASARSGAPASSPLTAIDPSLLSSRQRHTPINCRRGFRPPGHC